VDLKFIIFGGLFLRIPIKSPSVETKGLVIKYYHKPENENEYN